jgi:hypothetical protein
MPKPSKPGLDAALADFLGNLGLSDDEIAEALEASQAKPVAKRPETDSYTVPVGPARRRSERRRR